jgi:hypothetical protein
VEFNFLFTFYSLYFARCVAFVNIVSFDDMNNNVIRAHTDSREITGAQSFIVSVFTIRGNCEEDTINYETFRMNKFIELFLSR